MSIICQYCNHEFSTKSNLTAHQNKAIYCLKLQCKVNDNISVEEAKKFKCIYCIKGFTLKHQRDKHEEICTARDIRIELTEAKTKITVLESKLEDRDKQNCELRDILELKLEDKNKQIQELRDQVKSYQQAQERLNLAAVSKPTTSTKTINKNILIQSFAPITEANMREQLPYLTIEHIKQGAQGYAQYAMEYNFKDKLAVTDASRKKLAWKNIDGEIVYDTEGSQLSGKFFRIIKERNTKLIRELINELEERFDEALKREDHTEANALADLNIKLSEYKKHVIEGARGTDNELKDAFVKCLCTLSTKNI